MINNITCISCKQPYITSVTSDREFCGICLGLGKKKKPKIQNVSAKSISLKPKVEAKHIRIGVKKNG